MTDPAPALPPWVHPYEPDFRELLRQLDLVPGFIFQPIVLPSPDLARALADWLATQDVAVRVFDMRHDPWDELGTQFRTLTFDPAAERRAVVVITPSHFDRTAARDGLAAFNFSRDSIAENLHCPLLWCGDVHLLRTTAELASDFWSIAATVYRIPLRALSDVPPGFGLPAAWWTGAVLENSQALAERLEQARNKGTPHALARACLDLAEAALAQGESTEAFRLLLGIEAVVTRDASSLFPRWQALENALGMAAQPSDELVEYLQHELAEAHARGARAAEALIHQRLCHTLHLLRRNEEASQALRSARRLYLDLGDQFATLAMESLLIAQFYDCLTPGEIGELSTHAERMMRGELPPKALVDAHLLLAEVARNQQRWNDADEAAATALESFSPEDPRIMRTLVLRRNIARLRGDWAAAVTFDTRLLEHARTNDIVTFAAEAHRERARSYVRLGQIEAAWRDLMAARELGIKLGSLPVVAQSTVDLAFAALGCSEEGIRHALLARAFALSLRLEGHLSGDAIELLRQNNDSQVTAILTGSADCQALLIRGQDAETQELIEGNLESTTRRAAAIHRLGELADQREASLTEGGISLFNIDTWPTTSRASEKRRSYGATRHHKR
ncbi:hypothetical protein OV203_24815 [Nannocystis sp. ILAH1]|uniref:hypothetical protein n=1 Tax=Nannocystis sp. ILAH1 TaxID=2996789 RepID=UPI00226DDE23|nr:hypothetical protein [Nannocystis sp. ILAH1]MCY0990386.1 hypothetical protein [Nannocystis sp. ILAH1]